MHATQIGEREAVEWLVRAQLTMFELPFLHYARQQMLNGLPGRGPSSPGLAVPPQSRIPSLAVATAARLHDESIQGFIKMHEPQASVDSKYAAVAPKHSGPASRRRAGQPRRILSSPSARRSSGRGLDAKGQRAGTSTMLG